MAEKAFGQRKRFPHSAGPRVERADCTTQPPATFSIHPEYCEPAPSSKAKPEAAAPRPAKVTRVWKSTAAPYLASLLANVCSQASHQSQLMFGHSRFRASRWVHWECFS